MGIQLCYYFGKPFPVVSPTACANCAAQCKRVRNQAELQLDFDCLEWQAAQARIHPAKVVRDG